MKIFEETRFLPHPRNPRNLRNRVSHSYLLLNMKIFEETRFLPHPRNSRNLRNRVSHSYLLLNMKIVEETRFLPHQTKKPKKPGFCVKNDI
jgi:uncharacterized protein with HEPN domain